MSLCWIEKQSDLLNGTSFYSSAVDSVANDLDTEALYFKLLRQEKLNIALADLRKPDRLLVEYVYGICPKCLRTARKRN